MSVKSKLLATAATLTLVGGASAVGLVTSGTANASSAECGISCVDFFPPTFGNTHFDINFLLDDYKQGQATGTPQILFQASNTDPAEDYTVAGWEPVSTFFQAGLVSYNVALHYGCNVNSFPEGCASDQVDDWATEIQYSPYGAPTGECVGLAATAVSGEKVSLQPCGVSGKTLWIADTLDGEYTLLHTGYFPLINGSDDNFSQPFVLTYPGGAYPTNEPRAQLEVTNLSGVVIDPLNPTIQDISSNQLWGFALGQVTP